jgi:PPIC-type PPIASE domain
MTHWLRNPILHFVILGGLLFVGREVWQQRDGARTPGRQRPAIIITAQQLSQLHTDFAQQWGVPPTKAQMQGLIQDAVDAELLYREARRLRLDFEDRSIRARLVQKMRAVSAHPAQDEEALYQEAVRLGLDDDVVIKRMLRQKMRLLLHATPPQAPPQEQDMLEYVRRHRDRFLQPATVTFSHVFLSARVRGARLDTEAETVLAQLRAHATPPDVTPGLADPFPLGQEQRAQSRDAIARVFGSDFAEQVFTLPLGTWAGPLVSPFGRHLIWVHDKHPEQMPPLDAVWSQVAAEVVHDRAAAQLASGLQRLRSLYDIRIEWRDSDMAQDASTQRRQS